MAYYTDVKLIIAGRVVGTSARADVGLPGEHKLTVTGVTWTDPSSRAFLDYLEKNCTVQASGPQNTPVMLNLKISGIKGVDTVHLD